MFTGIISELGTVRSIEDREGVTSIAVDAPLSVPGLSIGDSVSVNGVCLTTVSIDGDAFLVEAVPETLERTSLGVLAPGSPVNLERPMSATGRYDGHIVQGHVDGVGTITSVSDEGGSARIRVSMPGDVARYVVEKGSICVDGTSLTVTAVGATGTTESWFEFVLIPHTLEVTVFGTKQVGDPVNIEVDVIAKYVERLMGESR
jgi:riboflavin synthase